MKGGTCARRASVSSSAGGRHLHTLRTQRLCRGPCATVSCCVPSPRGSHAHRFSHTEGRRCGAQGGYLAMKRLGVQVTELRVVGGGSKNPLWRRIIADVFQVPPSSLHTQTDVHHDTFGSCGVFQLSSPGVSVLLTPSGLLSLRERCRSASRQRRRRRHWVRRCRRRLWAVECLSASSSPRIHHLCSSSL